MIDALTLTAKETFRLYKWDADIVGDDPPDPTKIDASQHPGCAEIWEMNDGEPPRMIHQRK